MDEEKRTCKTCHMFREHANYCTIHDSAQAEGDTCLGHETYEEFEARAIKEHGLKNQDITKESPISQLLYRLAATTLMAIYNDPILIAMMESFCKENEPK